VSQPNPLMWLQEDFRGEDAADTKRGLCRDLR
jgi:hypothetical protein